MKHLYRAVALLALSSPVFAVDVECVKSIHGLFTGHSNIGNKIYITHPGNGNQSSAVRLDFINNDERTVDRILSVLLAAKMSNKQIKFRYVQDVNGDAASCDSSVTQVVTAVHLY